MIDVVQKLINEPKNKEIMDLLKKHDIVSYEHSIHVCEAAYMLLPFFEFKDMNEKDRGLIVEGALLHDCGKIFVPSVVLNSTDPLNSLEISIIRKHPLYGMNLLKGREQIIKNICLLHHERIDGSGYPAGFVDGIIPDYCRFITAIDILEALSAKRPYKQAFTAKQIIDETKKMSNGLNLDMSYFYRILDLVKDKKVYFINEYFKEGVALSC